MRKIFYGLGVLVVGLGLAVGVLWEVAGCQQVKPSERSTRLMVMAAEEAHLITDPKERLMRELNLADFQIQAGNREDGRKTLALAASTLREAKKGQLDEHGRISGWVSVSELSRAANDKTAALAACDEALELLTRIEPVGRRCDFALGLASEIRVLRGDKESGQLLLKAGEWAGDIKDTGERRLALRAFADRLFVLNDYEGGRKVLRYEADAAWRSDTMLALANPAPVVNMSGMARSAAPVAPLNAFGKAVDYQSNYANKEYQQQLRQAEGKN